MADPIKLSPTEEIVEAVRAVQTWDAITDDMDLTDPAFADALGQVDAADDWLLSLPMPNGAAA